MSTVRYALPRQGATSQTPSGSYGMNNMRQTYGGAGNQNFNNLRRQNSQRKAGFGQQTSTRARIDSAQGNRGGIRQSIENPAYRLINQQQNNNASAFLQQKIGSTDQNFVMNGNPMLSQSDKEVANITSQQDQAANIVHLQDPKMIEGFGSNVVHVNVSCGQTLPEQTQQNNNNNTTSKSKQSKTADESQKVAAPETEEDEEAQTFIIQLSEYQTRQLATGTLKLNGVPIPKDLSNLNYSQIMALLDSVNLPPQQTNKEKPKSCSNFKSATPGHSSQLKQGGSTPLSQLKQHNEIKYAGSEGTRKTQHPQSQTFYHRQKQQQSQQQQNKQSSNQNFSTRSNFMQNSRYTAASGPQAYKTSGFTQSQQNDNLFKKQQNQYHQGNNLMNQLDRQALSSIKQQQNNAHNNESGKFNLEGKGQGYNNNNNHRQSTSNRGANTNNDAMVEGRKRSQHYTGHMSNATQKAQRVDSGSRRARATRQQAASHGNTKKESDLILSSSNGGVQSQQHQKYLGTQNYFNSNKQQQSAVDVAQSAKPTQLLNQTMSQQSTRNGASQKVGSGNIMGSSEWDMLTMLSQQQQQLKNAQQHFFQNQAMNLEHARKLHGSNQQNNNLINTTTKTPQPNDTKQQEVAVNNSSTTNGQIQANNLMYQGSVASRDSSNQQLPVGPVEVSRGKTENSSSQPMITSMLNTSSVSATGSTQQPKNGFNYSRTTTNPSTTANSNQTNKINNANQQQQYNPQHHQHQSSSGYQRSTTRQLSSKRRIPGGAGGRNLGQDKQQQSFSRGFLKSNTLNKTQSSARQVTQQYHHAPHVKSAPATGPKPAPPKFFNLQHQQDHYNHQQQLPPQQQIGILNSSVDFASKGGINPPLRQRTGVVGPNKGSSNQFSHCQQIQSQDERTNGASSSLQTTQQSINDYLSQQPHKQHNQNNYNSSTTTNWNKTKNTTNPGQKVAAISTKNQISKTSIELEYSQLESQGGHGNAAKIGMGHQQHHQLVKNNSRKNIVQNRIASDNSQTSQLQPQPAPYQKLRINQQAALNNSSHHNLSHISQNSTHKRKIESALAQSAINAIQSQTVTQHGTNKTTSASQQSHHQQQQKPVFIMRNTTNQMLNTPTTQQDAGVRSSLVKNQTTSSKPLPISTISSALKEITTSGPEGEKAEQQQQQLQQPCATSVNNTAPIKSQSGFNFMQQSPPRPQVMSSKTSAQQQSTNVTSNMVQKTPLPGGVAASRSMQQQPI